MNINWPSTLIALLLLAVLGGWLLASVVLALRKGRANAAGRIFERDKQPGRFALTVIMQIAFAATALALLTAILSDRFKPTP